MIGDAEAWDTGLETECRFLPIAQAAEELRSGWHHQEEYVKLLHT